MSYSYRPKPEDKLKADYLRRKQKGLSDQVEYHDFKRWYESKEKVCCFCGLKEEECQKIVMSGLLKSEKFPQNGALGRGQGRGMWLEIAKFKAKENYLLDNCVLCCYFCHNDKSDVFNGQDYKEFQNDRAGFLRKLLNEKK
jgi:hypothetical protein